MSHQTMKSATELADVIIAGPNKLPLVKNAVEDHFTAKGTKPEDQVKQIFGCFQGVLPCQWINANKPMLAAKTVDDFFGLFWTQHLKTDWDVSICRSITAMRQKPDESFSDYSIRVRTKNALLVGTAHVNDDAVLINILGNGMLNELADHVDRAKPALLKTSLKVWEEEVFKLDTERLEQLSLINLTIAHIDRNNNKHPSAAPQTYLNQKTFHLSSTTAFNHSNSNATASSSSSTACSFTTASNKTHSVVLANNHLEALTDDDKENLNRCKGSHKCRKLFVNHTAINCPDSFPDPATYQPLTDEFCAAAERRLNAKSKPKVKPAAVTVPVSTQGSSDGEDDWSSSPLRHKKKPVAAVMQQPSDDDKYEDSDRTVSNHFVPSVRGSHLVWQCEISGPLSSFPIKTRVLIDNGSHLVLIRPELTAEMGLKLQKLKVPEHVDVALKNGDSIPTILSDYVTLKISSHNGQYSSQKVVAVIAPNLCFPMILGLPFLCDNHVIDHSKRTCIDCENSNFQHSIMSLDQEPSVRREVMEQLEVFRMVKEYGIERLENTIF
ncbi:hypothetical protein C8J56DRAFT_1052639 [Mycena floridula]|nr:hypothetical protein C8J56DRAFT_1052639 [Mycena floridula]